jgi:hypothetical protein
MSDCNISHALGLHMHQPPGNLMLLIESNPWQAEEIIRCYQRVPRYAGQYRDVARLHVGFSGVFRDPTERLLARVEAALHTTPKKGSKPAVLASA